MTPEGFHYILVEAMAVSFPPFILDSLIGLAYVAKNNCT